MNTRIKKLDDLTSIKGIGATRQEWFRNRLGISTYQDLATLSSEKILSQLKSEGMIASRGEVERWIAQAGEIANRKGIASPEVWEPFTSFVVEFQSRQKKFEKTELCTTVQQMETGEEKWPVWSGIETEQLCNWIRERVEKEVAAMKGHPKAEDKGSKDNISARVNKDESENETEGHIESASELPAVVVDLVQVFQPPHAASPIASSTPGQPFIGLVRRDVPFDLLGTFSVNKPDMDDLQQRKTPYFIEFYARELPFSNWVHLGNTDAQTLTKGKNSYTLTLPGVSLSAGIYALRILARLQSTPPIFSHYEIPRLRVV